MTKEDKVLYASFADCFGSTRVDVAGSTSLSAWFLFIWVSPYLVLEYILADERTAHRVLPVRYEDLIGDTERVWTDTILPFCGLEMRRSSDGDTPSLLPRALRRDSQKHSPISHATMSAFSGTLLPRDIENLNIIIQASGIAPTLADFKGVE